MNKSGTFVGNGNQSVAPAKKTRKPRVRKGKMPKLPKPGKVGGVHVPGVPPQDGGKGTNW